MRYIFIRNKPSNAYMLFGLSTVPNEESSVVPDVSVLSECIISSSEEHHYQRIDISEEHDEYIPFLSRQDAHRIGLYMSSDYELDVTSNAFTEDYRKYVDEHPAPEEIPEETLLAMKAEKQRKEDALKKLRSQRDTLIDATDKYVTPDFPIDNEKRKKWYHYRQHLRDLPAMVSPDLDEDGNLVGVEWPDAPN